MPTTRASAIEGKMATAAVRAAASCRARCMGAYIPAFGRSVGYLGRRSQRDWPRWVRFPIWPLPHVSLCQRKDELAGVLALEEPEQGVGEGLEALDYVLARLELAGGQPAGHLLGSFGPAVEVVGDDEPGHAGVVDQQRPVIGGAPDAVGGVVLGDGPADDDTRLAAEPRQRRVEDLAPHVVEVDVDAVGAVLSEGFGDVLALVVDRGVEAEVVDHVAALLGPAGNANGATALDLGDLAHHLAHGP